MKTITPFDHLWSDIRCGALELLGSYGSLWSIVLLFVYLWAFYIASSHSVLQAKKAEVQRSRLESLEMVKKIEQLRTTRDLAVNQDPFYMERSIRETFHLKKIPSLGSEQDDR